jgi:RNA polymerase sigma-70 factor (ECF subfamily)
MMRGGDREAAVVAVISAASIDLLAYFEYRVGVTEAPDLLAETMITAWKRSDVMPVDAEEGRMWLFGVARNVLLNSDRASRRRWRLASKLRVLTHPTAQTASSADSGLDVRDAVDRLPPAHAELIRLVHWDGFTVAEAAEICGIPASTARGRYQAAKAQLRDALGSSERRRSDSAQEPPTRGASETAIVVLRAEG